MNPKTILAIIGISAIVVTAICCIGLLTMIDKNWLMIVVYSVFALINIFIVNIIYNLWMMIK